MTILSTAVDRAAAYLQHLCDDIPNRAVGSSGNQQAADWFARTIVSFGFTVEMPSFACMDWSADGASLSVDGLVYPAYPSPYALGCDVRAPLLVVNTLAELETAPVQARIVLLRGEIAREPLMPKHFIFYNPQEHQRIYQLLEQGKPAAIVTATGHSPETAGAIYPFPLFEDGDFDIPSVYLTDVLGEQLAQHVGREVHLVSRAERRPATACNVIARRVGQSDHRIVIMAHIDAKAGTPGALDDGGGIVTLLLLAEALRDFHGQHTIEIVAINGEDYYSAPGEMEYLRRNEAAFDTITLAINLDGLGYIKGRTAYSLYGCPHDVAAAVRDGLSGCDGLVEGEPWYQGDHMLMVINQRPALALTSDQVTELMTTVIHTRQDVPSMVDPARLVEAANALHAVISRVDKLRR